MASVVQMRVKCCPEAVWGIPSITLQSKSSCENILCFFSDNLHEWRSYTNTCLSLVFSSFFFFFVWLPVSLFVKLCLHFITTSTWIKQRGAGFLRLFLQFVHHSAGMFSSQHPSHFLFFFKQKPGHDTWPPVNCETGPKVDEAGTERGCLGSLRLSAPLKQSTEMTGRDDWASNHSELT